MDNDIAQDQEKIKTFWNKRVEQKNIAGSNDFMLKELELEQLLSIIPNNSKVLDIGCGNGESLINLAEKKSCCGVGVDFAENLIGYAQNRISEKNIKEDIKFETGQIPGLSFDSNSFDIIISERCMINLPTVDFTKTIFI